MNLFSDIFLICWLILSIVISIQYNEILNKLTDYQRFNMVSLLVAVFMHELSHFMVAIIFPQHKIDFKNCCFYNLKMLPNGQYMYSGNICYNDTYKKKNSFLHKIRRGSVIVAPAITTIALLICLSLPLKLLIVYKIFGHFMGESDVDNLLNLFKTEDNDNTAMVRTPN